MRLILHFLIATLCTFVLASLLHSQFVLYELSAIGVTIDWPVRLSSSLDDLLGLSAGYAPIIALGLLIGVSTMALIRHKRPTATPWLYPLGGLLAMTAMQLAMHPILDITLIAGARGPWGFTAQCLTGFFGGWAFMHLRKSQIQSRVLLNLPVKSR